MRLLLLFISFLPIALNAQSLKGKVFELTKEGKQILPGATVVWVNTQTAAITNENGVFEISSKDIKDLRLVAMHLGYHSDTLNVKGLAYVSFTLKADTAALKAVTVKGARDQKLEVINERELTKAACCDLSGCFETQATVQPQTTNVITNSKELRILGLSGVYNQVLFDGMPMFQGLTHTYGISSYPGTLVNTIYVAKGASSVLQGYEGISGQVNVIPKDPEKTDRLLLNVYGNSFLETHYNANFSSMVGKQKNWSSLLAFHSVLPAARVDRDKDQFLDLPLLNRYMIYNRWKFSSETRKGIHSNIGLRFLNESRLGGHKAFERTDKGSNNVYGQLVNYTQPELYTKTGYRFSKKHALTFIASAFIQKQNSWFGTVKYDAAQFNAYANLQHEINWKDDNSLKYGFSYRYQDLTENISFFDTLKRGYAGAYVTRQIVPGAFAENSFSFKEGKIVWILGARMDHHQSFGWMFTPRSMLKYALAEDKTLRLSAGTGWRQVNLFSENINLLASSRDVIFVEPLDAEKGLNWGVNYFQRFEKEHFDATLSLDFYQTMFRNQFFPDYDSDPGKAYIRNFTGTSMSNAFQAEVNMRFKKVFEIKAAYNFLDVYRKVGTEKTALPFNPRNRAMLALSFRPAKDRWYFDINAHWYDRQRLPNTASNPDEYRMPSHSKPYFLLNAQITHKIKAFEIYGGVENIFDFRQKRPIISWQDPFSKYFDTSLVWGPTRGREIYLGLRYRI